MKRSLVCIWALTAALCTYAQSSGSYVSQVQAWHAQRMESLKAENGWLNLAGLFWLGEGRQTFGAGTSKDLVFPEGTCDAFLGHIEVKAGEVWVYPRTKKAIQVNGKALAAPLRIYPSDTQVVLQSSALRYFVVKRGDRFALRLRDLKHPALAEFKGVETFPADTAWRVRAKFEASEGRQIPITNVLGQTSLQASPGTLVFELGGTSYRLDAVEDDGKLFILFADRTSGLETYGSGRFLYAEYPDAEGFTTLDFNYSINPPCAFTPYATCPLPPQQNILPIAVEAGEKNGASH